MCFLNGSTLSFYRDKDFYSFFFLSKRIIADIIETSGPDSYNGLLASVLQGSTDTTFYVLSVYFGSVGISNYRYALSVGLLADMISMCSACW